MQPTLYTITPIAPRQLRVKAGHHKWNLAQADLDSVVNNPITTSDDATLLTAVAVLTRTDTGFEGHTYYLEEENTPHGWDSTDCELVVAEPMPQPHILPAGALPVPVNVTDLTLVVSVKGYTSKTEAASDINAKIALPAGEYLVFTVADNGMACIGQSRGGIKYWINPADNQLPVPEVVAPVPSKFVNPREHSVQTPEPVEVPKKLLPSEVPVGDDSDTTWKSTYKPFHENGSPEVYQVLSDWKMKDYSGTRTGKLRTDGSRGGSEIVVSKNFKLYVTGTFTKDNVEFYRVRDYSHDEYYQWYYAVPKFDDDANPLMRLVVPEPAPTPQRFSDLFHVWRDDVVHILRGNKFFDVFFIKDKGEK